MKLSDTQAAEIKELWDKGGIYQHELAVMFDVSQSAVSMIVNGKRRTGPRLRNVPPKGLITDKGRECSHCGVFKDWGEYSPNPRAKLTGHQSACKVCRNGTAGQVRAVHVEDYRLARRGWYLRHKYGLTLEQYERLAEQQDHKCALCGQPETQRRRQDRHGVVRVVDYLGVDHDHSCERHGPDKACAWCIRSLLCDDCNRLVGFAEKTGQAWRFADYLVQRPLLEWKGVVW
jgi:hypothetical protein